MSLGTDRWLRYDRVVKSLRSIAVVLLLALLCGPAMIDPCLFDCHDSAAADSAVPPCHDVASHDGLAVSGVSACDHDHAALAADAVGDVRLTAHQQHEAVPVSETVPAVSLRPVVAAWSSRAAPPLAPRTSLDLPLRL